MKQLGINKGNTLLLSVHLRSNNQRVKGISELSPHRHLMQMGHALEGGNPFTAQPECV